MNCLPQKGLLLLPALLLALAGCGLWAADGSPVIVAHRGAADLFPENSRRAILGSIERGFAGVEIDLVLSSDRVPVLWHNPWLDSHLCQRADGEPLPEGERFYIRDHTLAQLQEGFRCGGKQDPKHPRAELAWDSLATLDEVLVMFASAPSMWVHLDVKFEPGHTLPAEDYATEILGRWRSAALPNPVYASATTAELLRAFREQMPKLELSLIWPRFTDQVGGPATELTAVGAELTTTLGLQSLGARILDAKADGIAIAWQVSSRHTAQKLKEEGFKVRVWTVNGERSVRAYCDWPVEALITDDPEDGPCP